ncbi:hypothetical protein Tco_1124760 [Tanacetum coccineum]|uniref:Uncharacterized protein n=1 Tax=Tanacetum coccineum TaxID=301880 RepID=A0ABQ5J8P9_9ASTR
MGDENSIHTQGDYSKLSHEGYRNTIELLKGNNMVPLRSDTIRTVKLRNDILMFQQNHGDLFLQKHGLCSRTYSKKSYRGIDLWLQVQFFYDHVNPVTRRTIEQSDGGVSFVTSNPGSMGEIIRGLAIYDSMKEFGNGTQRISLICRSRHRIAQECPGVISRLAVLSESDHHKCDKATTLGEAI